MESILGGALAECEFSGLRNSPPGEILTALCLSDYPLQRHSEAIENRLGG
jgi:hypothetical protein